MNRVHRILALVRILRSLFGSTSHLESPAFYFDHSKRSAIDGKHDRGVGILHTISIRCVFLSFAGSEEQCTTADKQAKAYSFKNGSRLHNG